MKSLAQRFWEKTRREKECLLWTAKCDKHGYGVFRIGDKLHLSHRVAYRLANGEYDESLCVMHTKECEHRNCVNHEHLTLGPYEDVVALRGEKGHHPSGDRNGMRLHPEAVARGERHGSRIHPELVPKGERHYEAKLTTEQVTEIRRVYASGGINYRGLAARYGVSHATIWRIVQGKSWRAIE